MIRRSLISAVCIAVVSGSIAAAQAPARAGGAAPAPMKNLQVLPKDMPQPQVVAIMRAFNAALGVQCGHCHVWTKPGAPTNDMAADTKVEKTVAREMMRMTNEINTKLATIKPRGDFIDRVGCAMCHRGEAIPVTPPPPSPPVAAPAAPPAK